MWLIGLWSGRLCLLISGFRAAQYFEDHLRREKAVCVEVLAGLLREDVEHTGRGWFFGGTDGVGGCR